MKLPEIDNSTQYLDTISAIDCVYGNLPALSTFDVALLDGYDGSRIVSLNQVVDFDGTGYVDLGAIVKAYLSAAMPSQTGYPLYQYGLHYKFKLEINGQAICDFNMCGYERAGLTKLSDIDQLRVPADYIVPLTRCRLCSNGIYGFADMKGNKLETMEGLASERFPVTVLLPMPETTRHVRAFIDADDGTLIKGPELIPSYGHFEQYLFANRYGGFDNIPMDGTLEFSPKHKFEVGRINDKHSLIASETSTTWKQNSGFQTRKTVKALSLLMNSKQVYHLKEGAWEPIVITSCDVSLSSFESLHSITFEYKHLTEE